MIASFDDDQADMDALRTADIILLVIPKRYKIGVLREKSRLAKRVL